MRRVVIDVGCAVHPGEDSVSILISRFRPDALYGFDPLVRNQTYERKGTLVMLKQLAAWTYDGQIGFRREGSRSRISPATQDETPCFDLATFIADTDADEIVLKLDVESAEYFLLPHLHTQGVDERLTLAIVEWHYASDPDRRVEAAIREEFAAPIEDWRH